MNVKERLMQFIAYNKISVAEFERICGLGNAYVNNIRVSVSPKALTKFLEHYPELNEDWLLYGEGEMLKPQPPSQTANGDGNTQVAGNGNHVNGEKLIDELAAQRKLTEKAQEQVSKSQQQIDRLLSIIERLTATTTEKTPQNAKTDGA